MTDLKGYEEETLGKLSILSWIIFLTDDGSRKWTEVESYKMGGFFYCLQWGGIEWSGIIWK